MRSPRPVVGITCYVEPISRGDWVEQRSAALPVGYLDHIHRAGGIAVMLPPRIDADPAMAREVLSRLDAVIVAGGADVEPFRYGEHPHPSVQPGRPDRDGWELALVGAAIDSDLPLLGICRGMQVMAVQAGAQLEQHLPDRVGHEEHSPHLGAYSSHPVTVVAHTRLSELLDTSLVVPTYHHQAVRCDSLAGTAYRPAAWHPDGTLEAMEDPLAVFRIGVQWHPEVGSDPRLFVALVLVARGSMTR